MLLYTPEDVERQFGMSARSRLSRKEIQAILRSLRQLDRKKRKDGEVIATPGEILAEDENGGFERDSATDDTRVRTAVCWLEEARLLTREQNQVQVFPSSLRVGSVEQARQRLARAGLQAEYQRQLLALVDALIGAAADEGLSTDELMGVTGLGPEKLRTALHDLERLGIASNDMALTAYLQVGVENPSSQRFEKASRLELALIDLLREQAPELVRGESSLLHLRLMTQRLKDDGHAGALPARLRQLLTGIAGDGHNDDGGLGSIAVRRIDAEMISITLQRDWSVLAKTAQLRRTAAGHLLGHMIASLPAGARGADQLAETTLGRLLATLEADLLLKSEVRETSRLLDRALLWLHEQEVIRLNKGLAVFRPAMTIHLEPDWKRQFRQSDFAPLKLHYDEQVIQIHVMAEYVQRGLQTMADALRLTVDYFRLPRDEFMQRWLPDREQELARQTTPESWRRIVEALANPVQQGIVTDDRENANVLVLAGPGSGKTRVLVHRIAYLVRVRRENPRGILALAYNRHAAAQIRQRLADLIGDEAHLVNVLTCDALAMRLVGASFAGRDRRLGDENFAAAIDDVRRQAIGLLKGDELPPEQADEEAEKRRDRLLGSFRWILVDEYQDIGPQQYELIGALAGRSLRDEDTRLNLFAVGDDDQNIYAFNGASVEFIRRFESDYAARAVHLVDNYRATAQWKWLQPMRSFCEMHGIAVQMASEENAEFWRQRDTQRLLTWLHDDARRLINAPAITTWLAELPDSPVHALLDAAVNEYGHETGDAELPREHFIEWLAEWGREARRRQSGLLLLTAHRAKGLEFDHVAVLDGGWKPPEDRCNASEDPQAERRLYYVSMTRARQTLLLARLDRGKHLIDELPESASLLRRTASELPAPAAELSWRYQQLHPGEVDLGFAGRQRPSHPVHRGIAALTPGAVLHLRQEDRRWLLYDAQGTQVGKLAASYTPPAGMDCVAACVTAILVRYRSDSEPEYLDRIRCEQWEVVLPELVFAPARRQA